jgi:hypothetical protein
MSVIATTSQRRGKSVDEAMLDTGLNEELEYFLKAVVTAQSIVRGRLARAKFQQTKGGIILLQSLFKMSRVRTRFEATRNSCIFLQSLFRRFESVKLAQRSSRSRFFDSCLLNSNDRGCKTHTTHVSRIFGPKTLQKMLGNAYDLSTYFLHCFYACSVAKVETSSSPQRPHFSQEIHATKYLSTLVLIECVSITA